MHTSGAVCVTSGKKIYNKAGIHIATIGYNDGAGRWEIDAVNEPELECLFFTEQQAWDAWNEEFDAETGFRKSR
jgi:hypothetical protein